MTTALPQKNQSAYLHYCSEVRASIQQNNPGIKSVDIVKKQGEGWKSLSEVLQPLCSRKPIRPTFSMGQRPGFRKVNRK